MDTYCPITVQVMSTQLIHQTQNIHQKPGLELQQNILFCIGITPIIEVPLLFMTPPFCRQKCSKIYLGEYQLKNATTIGSTNCSVSHTAAASVSCFKWGWTTRTWGLLAPVLLGILTISLQLLQFQALCIVSLKKYSCLTLSLNSDSSKSQCQWWLNGEHQRKKF